MRYTLRQLEVFVAIARLENVSAAGRQLAMSQSATSTALAELERQFDVKLFDRIGKSLRLNEFGRELLPRAIELLDRAGEFEERLQGREGFGALRIGATLTIGNYLATLIVVSFLQRHAQSRVALEVHNTSMIIQRVARHELDLGLIEGSCRHPDLELEPWVEDELVVFCAPTHPLAARGPVSVDELVSESWILRETGSGTRETFERAMRHHHGKLDIKRELEHTEAIKRSVEVGLGIGCISRLALREAFRRGSLVPIETPELDLRRTFHFLWHREKYHSAAMQAFLGQCREMTKGVSRAERIELPFIP